MALPGYLYLICLLPLDTGATLDVITNTGASLLFQTDFPRLNYSNYFVRKLIRISVLKL